MVANSPTMFSVIVLCFLFARSQVDAVKMLSMTSCPGEECYAILREGASGWHICSYNTRQTTVRSQVRKGNSFETVSTCDMQTGVCYDFVPSLYKGEVLNSSAIITHIKSIRREETEFTCVNRNEIGTNLCKVEVYVWPTTASCDPVKLDYTGQNLEFTCSTDNVYPSLNASLTRKEIAFITSELIGGSCKSKLSASANIIPASCTWRIAVFNMRPQKYTFYARMRAYVTDYSQVNENFTLSPDVAVELRPPTAEIDNSSCPFGTHVKQGYVMAGSTATCRCNIKHDPSGLTPGQARWYNSDGSLAVPDDATQSSSSLVFKYSPSDPQQVYECRAYTNMRNVIQTSGVQYKPIFAYEPTTASIEIKSGDETVSLCPGKSPTTRFVCKAPVISNQPGIVFSILVDKKTILNRQVANQIINSYIYDAVVTHTSGGRKEVTCRAESSLFSELSISKSANVEVREPPSAAPVFTVTRSQTDLKSNHVNVTRGTDVEVKCQVDGGYPVVSNVTISCGPTVSLLPGNVGSIKLSVTNNTEGMRCQCSAVHILGCYDKSTQIILHVTDSATVQFLSVALGVICVVLANLMM